MHTNLYFENEGTVIFQARRDRQSGNFGAQRKQVSLLAAEYRRH